MHLHVCADWQMPQSIDVDRTKTQAMHHISTIQQQPTEQHRKKELRTEFGLHERYSPLFELPMNLYRCMLVPSQWIHHWPSMVLSMMQGGVWSTATTIYVAFFTDTGEVRTENNSTVNTKSDNWTTIFLSIQIKYGQLRACFAASSGEQSFEEEYCLLQSFDRAIHIVKTQSEMRRASPLLFNLPVYWQLSQHPPSRQKYQLSMSLVE